MSVSTNPVWDVYDQLRTARYNRILFGEIADSTKSQITGVDIFLAIAVPGSAVARLPFWHGRAGTIGWGIVVLFAAVVAVAKPILRLQDKLRLSDTTSSTYREIDLELQDIVRDIRTHKKYTDDLQSRFDAMNSRMRTTETGEPRTKTSQKKRDEIQARVNRELPAAEFYVPSAA